MAVTFNHLSWLSWRGKWQQSEVADDSSSNTTLEPGLWELDTSSSRIVKRKWSSHEAQKLDKENDLVLVPHDGGCISGSESEDSDWSVGWLEPHGPEFQSDGDESNNSFAVLVPCYGRGVQNAADNPQIKVFGPTGNFSTESKKYMEQWLSYLQID